MEEINKWIDEANFGESNHPKAIKYRIVSLEILSSGMLRLYQKTAKILITLARSQNLWEL